MHGCCQLQGEFLDITAETARFSNCGLAADRQIGVGAQAEELGPGDVEIDIRREQDDIVDLVALHQRRAADIGLDRMLAGLGEAPALLLLEDS